MSKEIDFLARQWGAVSASPLPDAVKKAFQAQVMPMLKVTPLTDPYITDATNGIINGYLLSSAVEILQKNARASEDLEKAVNGTLKTKLALKASALVGATAVAACILAVGAFAAGSALGALGADSWNSAKIAEAESVARVTELEAVQQEKRLAFLKTVNADLMTCKRGKIVVQENGRKACFYEDKGWFIE